MKTKTRTRPLPWPLRLVSALLVLIQPLACCPAAFAEAVTLVQDSQAKKPANETPRLNMPADQPVAVNRTLPQFTPPGRFSLPANPSDDEITGCGVLAEPLVPLRPGSVPGETKAENAALATALLKYSARNDAEDVSALSDFCAQHANSRWVAAVQHNLGLIAYHQGYFSQALTLWDQAWETGNQATQSQAMALANESLAQLMRMNARLGRMARVKELIAQAEKRKLTGDAATVLTETKEALALMQHDPSHSFRCGPLALAQIRASLKIHDKDDALIIAAPSTSRGCSLAQVAQLAAAVHMDYQVARRDAGAPVIIPAVVHWKVGHYAALVKQAGGKLLSKDLTFGNNTWLSQKALDAETSGYFLVPKGSLPAGWHSVTMQVAKGIWGCGQTSGNQGGHTSSNDPNSGCGSNPSGGTGNAPVGNGSGMAVYNVKAQSASLSIFDVPVGYRPPVGPTVQFVVTYSQRESGQPATFTYSNLGANWLHDWMAYVQDDPTSPGADALLFVRGGGYEPLTNYVADSSTAGTYGLDLQSTTFVQRVSNTEYKRYFRDGSVEVYGQPNNVNGPGRDVFLTQVIDPHGNALTLTYDSKIRLIAVKDAIGQVSTLSYGLAGDIYKITRVTDPFGRYATLNYTNVNGAYVLTSIQDVIGIVSRFTYQGSFISALTTPYGTTTFSTAQGFGSTGTGLSVDAIDPLGGHERTEYNQAVNDTFSDTVAPSGMNLFNEYLNYRDTYYWSKEAMMQAPGDYTKAKQYHFQHTPDGQETSGLLESVREGLESRVWRNYPGQAYSSGFEYGITIGLPSLVGRVLDTAGTTQLDQYTYNDIGNVTQHIDPQGRTTNLTYATNQIDLTQVQQVNGAAQTNPTGVVIISPRLPRGGVDTLMTATYNAQHLPLTMKDASGQTTTNTYNSFGEVTSVTNPKGETTKFVYNGTGYLLQVINALNNVAASFTYDGGGRIKTFTNAEGYTVGYTYDALNRVTQVSYPDGTADKMAYTYLDLTQSTDRLGRVTTYTYNPLRQLTSVNDPLGRKTQYTYCTCGALNSITDAKGNVTQFMRDVESRVTEKIYPDNTTTSYTYDFAGRSASMTDAKDQTTSYQYDQANHLIAINYPTGTPSVSFTYDAPYGRLASMTDGIGTTNYAYVPAGQDGGLQLASEQKPAGYGTATFTYDQLGRPLSRAVDGLAETVAYDALGRITYSTNSLGNFTFGYLGNTGKLQSMAYPNGQNFAYSYYGDPGSRRLQEMKQTLGANVVSNQQIQYNAAGDTTAWQQTIGTLVNYNWGLGYDGAHQLTSVEPTAATTAPNVSQGFTYDAAGNWTQNTLTAGSKTANYNKLNQLTALSASGKLVPVAYDPDGNLIGKNGTDNPSTRYTWDAANRLVSIGYNQTGETVTASQISYDGFGRMVRLLEKNGATTLQDRRFVWLNDTLYQERSAQGNLVKQFFSEGFNVVQTTSEAPIGSYYYGRNQLGSITNVTDNTGQSRAIYSYDPFGERYQLSGDVISDFGFTGLFQHSNSNLEFARYREFDPSLKRWLSRDPIGEQGGINVYQYADNNPSGFIDQSGLCGTNWWAVGAGVGALAILGIVAVLTGGTAEIAEAPLEAEITAEIVAEIGASSSEDALVVAVEDESLGLGSTGISEEIGASTAEDAVEAVADNGTGFFDDTTYSPDVLQKMAEDPFHDFPESVTAFEDAGETTTFTGGDGASYTRLDIPGSYQSQSGTWYDGTFEFIKDSDNVITHRAFIPN